MFLKTVDINNKSLVAEIVEQDYRTAGVFRRHGINYCGGGKWPLDIACEITGLDKNKIIAELEAATRTLQVSSLLDFANWNIDFLIDYLINIHHRYLKQTLPETRAFLMELIKEENKKIFYLVKLEKQFELLINQLMPSMQREEEIIFPYIRQIAHAHRHKEPYAALFVRTLRKPIEETMHKGHEAVADIILSIRETTEKYVIPKNASVNHKVLIARLKELDNDQMQHQYLEQSILFPRAMAIEKELLEI